MSFRTFISKHLGASLLFAVLLTGGFIVLRSVLVAQGDTATPQLGINNVAPAVSNVKLNGDSNITLTANATTSIAIGFTVTDNNGCRDVFTSGNVTSTAYRVSVGSGCTADNLNCYRVTTSTHNCSGTSTSANATATVQIYYFAQATDASSSFPSQYWEAHVIVRDSGNATGSATSTGVEVNTLLAIDALTTSINYSTVTIGADTSSTNQLVSLKNAGNSSTSLNLSGTAFVSGANSLATSAQHYATSSFTFGGSERQLTDTATAVTGFLLTAPTSTANVSGTIYWGVSVSSTAVEGTYNATNTFDGVFQP